MWFRREVLSHRCAYSLLRIVVLQLSIIEAVIFITKVFSFHPIGGLLDWTNFLLDWEAACLRLFICLSCVIFTIIHIYSREVKHVIYSSRYEIIRSWFSSYRMSMLVSFSSLGMLVSLCLYSILNESARRSVHKSFLSQRFLQDTWREILFVGGHGTFIGFLFCFHYFSEERNLLHFTLITEKSKFKTFVNRIKGYPKTSFRSIIKNLHRYYIIYVICDYYLFEWAFGSSKDSSYFSRLYSLVNMDLIITTVTTGVLLHFMWMSSIVIFDLMVTERYEFMIEAPSKEQTDKLLTNILASSELISKHLGFLDLRWLAEFSSMRRKHFFAISHPGGHPILWTALSDISTSVLSALILNLQKIALPKPAYEPQFRTPVGIQLKVVYPPSSLRVYWEKIINYVTEKPLWKYFMNEFPDVEALKLFTNCQLEIWVIETLGFFIASSYTEDNYGVVQTSLPQILRLLIDLKMCEEKLPISVMSFKKYVKDSRLLHIGKSQKQQLKLALESTLCRIVATFGNDIRSVLLPDNYKRQLERYLEVTQ